MNTASLAEGDAEPDDVKKAADEYNKIAPSGEGRHAAGLQQRGLRGLDGRRPADLRLLMGARPEAVKFQFQMSTISQGSSLTTTSPSTLGRFSRCTCRTWT